MTATNHPRGIAIDPLKPGSPEWYRSMSASKVAAVLGLSKWESPFSLWHRMAGLVEPEPQTVDQARGHYLEPAIAAWFADQHPEFVVKPGACWRHGEHGWATASPDRQLYVDTRQGHRPVGILEIKTDAGDYPWGKPGTDEIPVHYRAQVMWQMDVVGVDTCYVAVLSSYLEFREYVVHYDAEEAALIRGRCADFMRSLDEGRAPELDGSEATYTVVRQLPDGVIDEAIDVPDDIAHAFTDAIYDVKAAEERKRLACARLLEHMGDHRQARWNDKPLATRAVKADGSTHSLKPARGLTSQEAAA